MRGRTHRTAAVGTAAFVLAGSAALTVSTPTAAADPVTAKCGQTVTAKPGDTITTPFGQQTVTDGATSLVGGLLGSLCTITVDVVGTVVAPIPAVGQPLAGALGNTVSGTTNAATGAIAAAGHALSAPTPEPPAQTPPSDGGSPNPGAPSAGAPTPPVANIPVPPAGPPLSDLLPLGSGFAPMLDYSGIPAVVPAFWAPSPGVRYGGVPGNVSEPGASGNDARPDAAQNTGQAEALTGTPESASSPLDAPMVAAVLALSAVTAWLVRRWILRGTD
jgi:hypothetical protein